jgi:hypothetical protein
MKFTTKGQPTLSETLDTIEGLQGTDGQATRKELHDIFEEVRAVLRLVSLADILESEGAKDNQEYFEEGDDGMG